MGYEARCTLRIGNDVSRGTAVLEHRDLIFRGPTRVAIPRDTIASVRSMLPLRIRSSSSFPVRSRGGSGLERNRFARLRFSDAALSHRRGKTASEV
jgi:hypothetical protein